MGARRAPLDRLVDLMVAVPACTVVAARHVVPLAARVGTLSTARLLGRVSEAANDVRARGLVDEASVDTQHAMPETGHALDETEPLKTTSPDDLPIDGYDDLAARQVVDRLSALEQTELARIDTYEREHRHRSTVLGKISMLTDDRS